MTFVSIDPAYLQAILNGASSRPSHAPITSPNGDVLIPLFVNQPQQFSNIPPQPHPPMIVQPSIPMYSPQPPPPPYYYPQQPQQQQQQPIYLRIPSMRQQVEEEEEEEEEQSTASPFYYHRGQSSSMHRRQYYQNGMIMRRNCSNGFVPRSGGLRKRIIVRTTTNPDTAATTVASTKKGRIKHLGFIPKDESGMSKYPPESVTVFVGNLDDGETRDETANRFEPFFDDILGLRPISASHAAFVRFRDMASAVSAMASTKRKFPELLMHIRNCSKHGGSSTSAENPSGDGDNNNNNNNNMTDEQESQRKKHPTEGENNDDQDDDEDN